MLVFLSPEPEVLADVPGDESRITCNPPPDFFFVGPVRGKVRLACVVILLAVEADTVVGTDAFGGYKLTAVFGVWTAEALLESSGFSSEDLSTEAE